MNLTDDNVLAEEPPRPGGSGSGRLLGCDDIQMLLSAYMMRELGDVQSRVVREHLRTCDACRREAAEFQEMLDTLKAGAGEAQAGAGVRLSDERRARILRAVFHPVMDWIDRHHRLVSAVLAVLVVLVVLVVLRHAAIFRRQQLEEGIPIWRMFKSGQLPELVEKERLRHADETASPAKKGAE
jgi:hypothetical protein